MEDSRRLSASDLSGSAGAHNLQLSQSKGQSSAYFQQLDDNREHLLRAHKQIAELEKTVSAQQRTLDALNSPPEHAYFLERTKQDELERSLKAKTLEADALRGKLEAQQHSVDFLSLSKRSEGTLLLEIEHFKADNKRLVSLLRQTQDFKDFAELTDGGSRYIPKVKPSKKCHGDTGKEIEDWVPSEAWGIAHQFLAKFGSCGFKSVHINRLLEDMNTAWRQREKEIIRQVKSKCAREVKDHKRKIQHTPRYDQVRTNSQINRLKSDLQKARSDIRTLSSATTKAGGGPDEIKRIMKILADFQHENKVLSVENARLKKA